MMYKIEIFYSAEDEGYIAVAPSLPGCSAFGETEEEALEELKIAQKLWLETAQAEGRTIPIPNFEVMLTLSKSSRAIQAIKKGNQSILPFGRETVQSTPALIATEDSSALRSV